MGCAFRMAAYASSNRIRCTSTAPSPLFLSRRSVCNSASVNLRPPLMPPIVRLKELRHELVIDLRVARELRIKVPQELLLRADEVGR